MNDTRRLFLILSVLVRHRRAMTVQEIRRYLPKKHRPHVRSVQRDLVSLKRWHTASIRVDRTEKPYRWSFSALSPCPCCWKQ